MLKHISADLGFGKLGRADKPLTTHIPYTRHVSDTVIGLSTGAYCTTIKLDGLFFQTEDQAELNMRSAVQNVMIRSLGSSRYALWSTVVRREVHPSLDSGFDNDFCRELDARYTAGLGAKRMFVNELYLTIIRSHMRGALGIADRLSGRLNAPGGKETEREIVNELEEITHSILNDFQKYGPVALGITYVEGEPYSGPCSYFQKILSGGQPRDMRLPRMAIRDYVGLNRLHFGKRAFQIQGASSGEDRFGAVLSIKEYPPFSGPGLLDGLLQVNHEFILTQSFTIVDKPIAQERISRLQRQIAASDEAGSVVETDIDFALNSLLNQEAVFGNHHLTLVPITRAKDLLDKSIGELGSKLTDMNINWLREDLNMEAAFWAQLPGNHAYIARNALMSSANFAGFSSFHNFAHGKTVDLHWKTPISILETTSQTPYHFSFHQRDIGHFLVTGPTGSGKTVVMAFLLAQAFRVRPEPKAVFFDKDRGAEIFIRAIGGSYEILRPGTQSGFNPLQIDNTAPNRDFLVRLLKSMLTKGDAGFSQAEEDTLAAAIARLMREPAQNRTLANLAPLLMGQTRADENDLSARLRPWIDDGDKAWLFNAREDTLSFSGRRIFGFDMTSILDHPEVRTPALLYIYHRLDELLTGDPVMLFMDEGWKLLQDPTFSNYIVDKMKTIRKLNGIVGFGTQSAADIAKAPQSHTLIEQSATNIHFPNPRADEDSYISRFGLTAKEFAFLKNTPPERRTFLIKHGNDSVIARLDLSGMPDLVKVLSGRKETVEACATLRERLGDDPADWLPVFCGWEGEHAAA